MGCGCKNKKKPEGEVVKVENVTPTEEVKVEETKVDNTNADGSGASVIE